MASTLRTPSRTDGVVRRVSAGCVSGTTTSTPTSMATQSAATVQSIPRQPTGPASRPPTRGASTGATPPTVIISVNARAAARPVTTSAMIARPMTMPPAPAKPCTRRAATSTGREGATAQTTAATTQTEALTISGPRRPRRSDSGPITSWPNASPARNAVRVSWTSLASAPRSAPMAGKPGR